MKAVAVPPCLRASDLLVRLHLSVLSGSLAWAVFLCLSAFYPCPDARRPSGAKTCDFCLMLASRGPVYGTAEDAGGYANRYHDDCDCIPVPVKGRWVPDGSQRGAHWEGQDPGYDHDKLYAEEYKPYWQPGDTIQDTLARRRESLAELRKTEKRNTRKASRDGTLQRTKWDEYRAYVKNLAKERGIEIDGDHYKLPPTNWVEPPENWPSELPALRAQEWNHILFGSIKGGGHLSGFGWMKERTEFATDWTAEKISTKLREFLLLIPFNEVEKTRKYLVSSIEGKYAIAISKSRGKIRVTTFYPIKD